MEVHWPLVFFTLLTAAGAGAFGVVAILEWLGKAERARLYGTIAALVAMIGGAIASVFHLGHPERVFNVLNALSSGIAQEFIFGALTLLAMLAYLLLLRPERPARTRKIVAAIGLVLAVIFAFGLGQSYVLHSRPAWNTWILPFLYLISAAVLGLFVLYSLAALFNLGEAIVAGLNRAALIALAVQAVLVVAYLVFLAVAPFQDPLRSVARLLAGDQALVFWGGVVVIGLAIPLALTAWVWAAKKKALASVTVAVVGLICALIGGIAGRALMYILGSSIEKFV